MNSFQPSQQPWQGHGFQPLPPLPPLPCQPPLPLQGASAPQGFTVNGPSGYHGWGWSAEMGGNSSYLRYQDNAGGGFTLWRHGTQFRFQ